MTVQHDIVLVGGCGRTGTNLVKGLMATQPSVVALPFEPRITTDPDGIVPTLHLLRQAWSPFIADVALRRHLAFLSRVERRSTLDRAAGALRRMLGPIVSMPRPGRYADWELERWCPAYPDLVVALGQDLALCRTRGHWVGAHRRFRSRGVTVAKDDSRGEVTAALSRFLNAFFDEILRHHAGTVYLDDNTFNSLYAAELAELVPRACFVHVERDPRDVVASYLRQGWTPDDAEGAARYFKAVYRKAENSLERVAPERWTRVRLELLCDDTRGEVARICRLAGIDSGAVAIDRIPIDAASVGRWRRDLGERQRGLVERILRKEIDDYARH